MPIEHAILLNEGTLEIMSTDPLTCFFCVLGHPSPKVEWFRNRESLGSSWVILENRKTSLNINKYNYYPVYYKQIPV